MTTSGVYTFSKTLNEIVSESLDLIQAVGDGETLSGDSLDRCAKSLNIMLRGWQTQGIHLWTYTEGTLFLEVGQPEYDFRLSTTHVANKFFETTTTSDTVAGALSFALTNTDDIQAGDNIGIIQNDTNLFWTTVNSVSGLIVTTIDPVPLPTDTGAFVRNYQIATSKVPELIPVSRVLNVRRQESTDYEIPIIFESREDYFNLPNKQQNGTPIQAYYSRQDVAGETSGIMYLWNPPISSVPVINFTYERKLQIMVNPDDTLDLPDYAHEAVIYNLARRVMTKFGVSAEMAQFISGEADRYLDEMLSFDSAVYPIVMKMERYG